MRTFSPRAKWYRRLFVGEVACVVAIAAVSSLTKLDPEKAAVLRGAVAWNREWAWASIPAMTGVLVAFAGIRKALGQPWAWEVVQRTLDTFQNEFFTSPRPIHDHRITLFKHESWIWPWKVSFRRWGKWGRNLWAGWLVPVCRSGHVAQKSSTVFFCPDDPNKAEGVAGQAFVQKAALYTQNLPDMAADPSQQDVDTCARDAYLAVELVRERITQNRACARSFLAFVIERNNEPWGVVVLDSRDPNGIKSPPQTARNQKVMTDILNKLAERA